MWKKIGAAAAFILFGLWPAATAVYAGISGTATWQVLQVNGNNTWNLQWTANVTLTNPHSHVCLSVNNDAPTLCTGSGPYTCTRNNVPNNQTTTWQIYGYPNQNCNGNQAVGPNGSIAPLAVTLADFGAAQQGAAVQIFWETNSELNNRGFHLWRGETDTAPDRRLNDALILSQSPGGPGGHFYDWIDTAGLVSDTTYYYWLEDVDLNGATTRHGPVSVTYHLPLAVALRTAATSADALWPALVILLSGSTALIVALRQSARGSSGPQRNAAH